MKKFLFIPVVVLLLSRFCFAQVTHTTLATGAAAPDFSLPGIDGKTYTLQSFKDARVLAIVFMCNHCPTSQAYEDRVVKLTSDYAKKGVRVLAINPNNPASLRLDELGYSDVGDSFDDMKVRAKDRNFNFPYLYDGETEVTSNKYGPVATPHIFIFDQARKLRYNGRIDDMENPAKTPRSLDARNAIDALLAGKEVAVPVTKTFGCSIKWAEKQDWIQKAAITWASEPVKLDTIDAGGIANLVKNKTDKLRLINLWATWCGPCVAEFPELVTIMHLYRDRGLELVTISADDLTRKDKALSFLKGKQASGPNYIYIGDDKYKMIEAVDAKWDGALPYTMLVDPDGKVVYGKQGIINPEELKKIIFDDATMGRIYK
ncbi:redoxin domain-containing protein [Mucilaginibacter sp. SP1R1]|uniref:redoxin domain-containing protein n=1 Tax=Mucilaginibacter sp. SP1R1 TaxID=2723091 RepID=UPI00161C89C6|nr:redoxin domain-containing protein [Mucilaginibacter sp. SP1R1]MBB6147778.1 thiol-disulfide isomerase/thioredoxin [Mucilaginibacter sp. SP1R1]